MQKYMNMPVECEWTDEDIVREYNKCQDKKSVAKMYCIPVKEVTEILKRRKD